MKAIRYLSALVLVIFVALAATGCDDDPGLKCGEEGYWLMPIPYTVTTGQTTMVLFNWIPIPEEGHCEPGETPPDR